MTIQETTSSVLIFTLCNYPSLLTNGILRLEQIEDIPLEYFPAEERREHHVFEQLLDSYPGLLESWCTVFCVDRVYAYDLQISKGAAGARGDDTKTLKSAILDWISPKGEGIQPPLHRNSKIDRSFNHDLTGSLLCPAGLDWNDPQTKENLQSGEMMVCGDQWPIFLYAHHIYDPEDLWCGLLRSRLLVYAYKHVSSSVFSHTDTTTDLETFYHSLLDLLQDPEEYKEINELLTWWNRQVFPTSSAAKRPISANSALSKIRQKCLALKQASNLNTISS
ncbi:uncharacterized protein F5891DRAFT_1131120 [Suillus fuscotomentosus]|uniref:Uncharacterized protein n=1 Tax=Suillus fuscotomentosus TaxID=1912939 RepID=A0AAD4DTZ8_9AGAM|nr:uncharacterized protein F5891DRAFT_1131120 [Suillus fuscotomentosus]KAG1893901.1 hypothetical protein F5891DRAFT_1131120 [Suillus fuscotomentosus]